MCNNVRRLASPATQGQSVVVSGTPDDASKAAEVCIQQSHSHAIACEPRRHRCGLCSVGALSLTRKRPTHTGPTERCAAKFNGTWNGSTLSNSLIVSQASPSTWHCSVVTSAVELNTGIHAPSTVLVPCSTATVCRSNSTGYLSMSHHRHNQCHVSWEQPSSLLSGACGIRTAYVSGASSPGGSSGMLVKLPMVTDSDRLPSRS